MLKDFPVAEYNTYLQEAKDSGVHIVHLRTGRTGGATFAWRRAKDDVKCRMVEVAVSFCSPHDVFCRKIGTFHALDNFFNERTILLPVGSPNSEQIVITLRNMFGMAIYFGGIR